MDQLKVIPLANLGTRSTASDVRVSPHRSRRGLDCSCPQSDTCILAVQKRSKRSCNAHRTDHLSEEAIPDATLRKQVRAPGGPSPTVRYATVDEVI